MQLLMRRRRWRLHLHRRPGQPLRLLLPRALPLLGPVRPWRQGCGGAHHRRGDAGGEAEDAEGIVIEQQIIPGANHFFDGKTEELMGVVGTYLDKRLPGTRKDSAA